MNTLTSKNPEQKSVENFYKRVRSYLDDIEPLPKQTEKPITDKLKKVADADKYGVIEEKELNMLLSNYDEASEKPAKCDRLLANSFAKLLYSKPGFHHPSSTDYLVEDLNIKERDRDSFLGGHSTYATPEENSIAGVTRHYTQVYIRNRAKELIDSMNLGVSDHTTLSDDIRKLLHLDPNNANAMLVRGKHRLIRKSYKEAVADLKRSLELNCDYNEQAKLDLAEACYQYGLDLYTRGILNEASFSFHESLLHNPHHSGSILHASMCAKKIQETHRRYGDQANTFSARRR